MIKTILQAIVFVAVIAFTLSAIFMTGYDFGFRNGIDYARKITPTITFDGLTAEQLNQEGRIDNGIRNSE